MLVSQFMHAVLAIDTATDACSVGLAHGSNVTELHRIIPRAHNRHILTMIDELLDDRCLKDINAFACGVGPGSFTGLRVATSVIQGLAWSLDKPVMPMCSLELQARNFISHGHVNDGTILSVIDAQIGQVYWRWFSASSGVVTPVSMAGISAPADVPMISQLGPIWVVGSGARFSDGFSEAIRARIELSLPDVRPHAGDLARWSVSALQSTTSPSLLQARDLTPHYVQESIGWKKLSEQPSRV